MAEEPFTIDPIRLCCGKRWSDHLGTDGVVCPDHMVVCCICFHRVTPEELTTDPDGCKVNVCMNCTIDEAQYINKFDIERCKHGSDG